MYASSTLTLNLIWLKYWPSSTFSRRIKRKGSISIEFYKSTGRKGSFSPLVFTTTGGMAPAATRFWKRVAEKISAKTREKYSQVMSNIRTRFSFEIMRSVHCPGACTWSSRKDQAGQGRPNLNNCVQPHPRSPELRVRMSRSRIVLTPE